MSHPLNHTSVCVLIVGFGVKDFHVFLGAAHAFIELPSPAHVTSRKNFSGVKRTLSFFSPLINLM